MSLKGLNFETFFREADVNNDGHLSLKELIDTLQSYGYKNQEAKIKTFFKQADTSGDNRVSFDEYMAAMSKAPMDFHSEAAMRRIFSRYDKDGNGRIDRQELGAVLKEMGKVFSDNEVQKMMASLDTDKSGFIDYEEFIQAVQQDKI